MDHEEKMAVQNIMEAFDLTDEDSYLDTYKFATTPNKRLYTALSNYTGKEYLIEIKVTEIE